MPGTEKERIAVILAAFVHGVHRDCLQRAVDEEREGSRMKWILITLTVAMMAPDNERIASMDPGPSVETFDSYEACEGKAKYWRLSETAYRGEIPSAYVALLFDYRKTSGFL